MWAGRRSALLCVEGERAALEACDRIDADCDGVGDAVDDETTAASCRRCAADDQTSPCNGCREGRYVAAGFVCVPAGAPGRMGSPEGETGRSADREALHQIEITRPFLLGATEVTQHEAVHGIADWAVGRDGCDGALQTKAWHYCTVEGNPGPPAACRTRPRR